MIRINLIQRKQPSFANTGRSSGASSKSGLFSSFKGFGGASSDGILTLVKRVGIPAVLCLILNFAYDHYVQGRVEEMNQEAASTDQKKETINKELQKIKGFDLVKVELERNEIVLRTKINTIEKLIQGRDGLPKAMSTLAQSMPRDLWMTEMKANEATFEFRGGAIELSLVSDFMTKLGQTIYFRDVTLKSSSNDPVKNLASFELGAKRE